MKRTRFGWMGVWLAVGAVHADPPRVVTVGGAVTEIVYALGAGAQVVAVDQTSVHPMEATRLPNIGYLRNLSAEPVLALQPDLVLLSAEAGPPDAVAKIRASGIPVVSVPSAHNAAGVLAKVHTLAAALQMSNAGDALARDLDTAFAAVREMTDGLAAPRVLCLMSLGGGGLSVAGRDTAADAFIALAGGRNVFDRHHGYRALSPEILVDAAPDFILVTARSVAASGGVPALLETPAMRASGLTTTKLIVIDDAAALGFGPRLPAALTAVAERFRQGGIQAATAR
ncbi:MAG: hemin ABC transporter substrate-binding protein [Gammaproteobacteria bacterium]